MAVIHNPLFLAQKSVDATEADKQIVIDLLDTLRDNLDRCEEEYHRSCNGTIPICDDQSGNNKEKRCISDRRGLLCHPQAETNARNNRIVCNVKDAFAAHAECCRKIILTENMASEILISTTPPACGKLYPYKTTTTEVIYNNDSYN